MVHDQAAAFALDALDAEEASEFQDHLATCPACEDALEPLLLAAAALAFAGELPAPPPALRLRVVEAGAAVVPLHRRRRVLLVAVTAAAACLAVALAQPWQQPRPEARVLGSVLVVRHLRPAPLGKAYEAWIAGPGRIVPAGVLRGSMLALPHRLPANSTVLVSLEPAGGSVRPTGPVVVKAETT